jgi:hypothetical protein
MKAIERKLLPIVRKWHGVIPVWEARREGVDASALRHWAAENPDVEHLGRGVYAWYVDDDDVDWENMPLAKALAWAGPESFLWGPTVLECEQLGTVGGFRTCLAVPKRRRRDDSVAWKVTGKKADSQEFGLPSQNIRSAIYDSMPYLDSDKRSEVLYDAQSRDILTPDERMELEKQYDVR